MPPANILFSHFKKQEKEFAANLLLLRQRLTKPAIHRLRVSIKKLRAYEKLYRQLQTDNEPLFETAGNRLSRTIQLFESTGKQREVEICLALLASWQQETLKEYTCFHNYLLYLARTTKAWSNQAIHKFKPKELAAMTRLLRQDVNLTDAVALDKKIRLAADAQISAADPRLKAPHTLRKQLKTIYYWVQLLISKEKYAPALLDTILQELGQWQDHTIVELRIKHFRNDYLPNSMEEYNDLKKLERLIQNKKKGLLREIRKNLKTWLQELTFIPQ